MSSIGQGRRLYRGSPAKAIENDGEPGPKLLKRLLEITLVPSAMCCLGRKLGGQSDAEGVLEREQADERAVLLDQDHSWPAGVSARGSVA